jgi:hypothetical protein
MVSVGDLMFEESLVHDSIERWYLVKRRNGLRLRDTNETFLVNPRDRNNIVLFHEDHCYAIQMTYADSLTIGVTKFPRFSLRRVYSITEQCWIL